MKSQFMDVQAFVGEVQRLDDLKQDFIVSQDIMQMWGDKELYFNGAPGPFPLKDLAHDQLAAKLGIPRNYYDKMLDIPGLRSYTVNSWLKHEGKEKRLVRTQDGFARAYLSDRFRPLDNLLIVGAALPVLAENPDLQVRTATITDSRLYLQVSFPKIAGEIRVGDVVEFGFTLTTSEVGQGKVDVQKWFHQLKCKNGYVGESIFSRRHVGRRLGDVEEDYGIFKDETIEAEMKAFQLRLRDILADAINEKAFREDLTRFKNAAGDTFLHSEAESVVKNVTKHFQFREEDMKVVFNRMMQEGGQLSRLSLADAVTFVANHENIPADRVYDMERAGYDLVAMPAATWKGLVA